MQSENASQSPSPTPSTRSCERNTVPQATQTGRCSFHTQQLVSIVLALMLPVAICHGTPMSCGEHSVGGTKPCLRGLRRCSTYVSMDFQSRANSESEAEVRNIYQPVHTLPSSSRSARRSGIALDNRVSIQGPPQALDETRRVEPARVYTRLQTQLFPQMTF